MLRKLFLYFHHIKMIPAYLAYSFSENRRIIDEDIAIWIKRAKLNISESEKFAALNLLFVLFPEFFNVFLYRVSPRKSPLSFILSFFYSKENSLFIMGENIGGGLFIQHGFATIITVKSMGKNCWINQQVTLGYDTNSKPTIGNNVHVCAGAKVIGGVTVGDNCVIGANAVVVKDVPPNCTVVGVPAYIVKRDGIKIFEKL